MVLGLDPKFYFKINVVLFLFPHVIGLLCIIGWLVLKFLDVTLDTFIIICQARIFLIQ